MLKNLLKKTLIISLELLLIAGALWLIAEKRNLSSSQVFSVIENFTDGEAEKIIFKKPFPQLEGAKERVYQWEYKGVKYSITENLYESVNEFYKNQPKSFSYVGTLPQNWEEEYYGNFLKIDQEDKTIIELVEKIRQLGVKQKLTDDELVDLTMAFVQSIPYDDAKAENILAKNSNETMRYPYEVLFQQLGVCSDKSLLAIALLRVMGYGTAIFTYPDDNHMAIGIQCPKANSTYGSGYCYSETTAEGNKIGIVPSFDSASNKTVNVAKLTELSLDQANLAAVGQLGQVVILQKTEGREYLGIIKTEKIIAEINQLKISFEKTLPMINEQKKIVAAAEEKLTEWKNDLNKYEKRQEFEKYNALVEKYNKLFEQYKKDVKKLNDIVGLYNKTIQRYNTLIRQ